MAIDDRKLDSLNCGRKGVLAGISDLDLRLRVALPVEKQRTFGSWLVIFTVSPNDLGRIISLNRSHPILVVCMKQRSPVQHTSALIHSCGA
jgi:hypothetical protein